MNFCKWAYEFCMHHALPVSLCETRVNVPYHGRHASPNSLGSGLQPRVPIYEARMRGEPSPLARPRGQATRWPLGQVLWGRFG